MSFDQTSSLDPILRAGMATRHQIPSFTYLGLLPCLLLLSLLCMLMQGCNSQAALPPDFLLLLDFKNNLDGVGQAELSSWNPNPGQDNPCLVWEGVTCDTNASTVQRLFINNFDLGTTASSNLSRLDHLQMLDLGTNRFSGPLPLAPNLWFLNIGTNSFNGSIPSAFSQLQSTQFVYADHNSLTGSIPALAGLGNLTDLYLQNNNLTGAIPNLQGLTSLKNLLLVDNQLSGEIPSLQDLPSLEKLWLDRNQLSGEIPASVENLTSLRELTLSSNSLFGKAPDLLGLQGLRVLDLSSNQLQGPVPVGVANMTFLSSLNLSSNLLIGEPSDLTGLQILETMDLSSNKLEGAIPAGMADMPVLGFVNLSFNSFSSDTAFRAAAMNLTRGNFKLETLDLSNNRLDALVLLPAVAAWARNLQKLWLSNNQQGGDLDAVWRSIPATQVASLRELHLPGNGYTGEIGKATIEKWKGLEVLDLSRNSLTLDVALVLETLVDLRELRIGGGNNLGTFPRSLVNNLTKLEVLDLSSSGLQGEILPDAITELTMPSLRYLDLSSNGLTGTVPAGFTRIVNLTYFNLSGNNLYGPLPPIPPLLRSRSFFLPGNQGLCGDPLPACPVPRVVGGRRTPWKVILPVLAACILVSLGSCIVLGVRWRAYSLRHQQDADLIAALQDRDQASLMPLRELRRATKDFSQECKIGVGGFGTVYKGNLWDGAGATTVAIKRSNREGTQRDKNQFLNEVRILSQVNHRNLVRLLGCCLENKVSLLVFEYVSNGTLQDHLRARDLFPPLSWTQRLRVAAQTADALAYLHFCADPPIFHRDVKTANILLDDRLNAKVADFGISRLAPTAEATHVSTVIQGTMGYIDPEYYTRFQLTHKSDVYSFGVVLLELISARAAVDRRRGSNGASLVTWAVPLLEAGTVTELIDPAIQPTFDTLEGKESILSVGEVAVKCLKFSSKDRPSMREVWKVLHALSTRWDRGAGHGGGDGDDDELTAGITTVDELTAETTDVDSADRTKSTHTDSTPTPSFDDPSY